MNKIFYFIFISIFTISCEEEISVLTVDDPKAVVEGYIYANESVDSIRITESISYSGDGTLRPIDDLVVKMSNEDEEFVLESIGNGYYAESNHIVEEGKIYSLSFQYNGKEIGASTFVNSTKDMELSHSIVELEKIESGFGSRLGGDQVDVDVSWENSESDYYFVLVESIDENAEYVNAIFESNGVVRPGRFFRTEPEIIDIYTLNSRSDLQFFGNYDITVFRLNPEYAALYESVGTSSLSLQEPPSNVENGLGIFTAITPHRLRLQVIKR